MLRRIADENRSISLCSTVLKSVVVVRNLGVLFDSELTMKQLGLPTLRMAIPGQSRRWTKARRRRKIFLPPCIAVRDF